MWQRMADRRAARQAAVLRQFWQTHHGVTWQVRKFTNFEFTVGHRRDTEQSVESLICSLLGRSESLRQWADLPELQQSSAGRSSKMQKAIVPDKLCFAVRA